MGIPRTFFMGFFLYLVNVRELNFKTSAYYSMLPLLAMAVCSPLGGLISDVTPGSSGSGRAGAALRSRACSWRPSSLHLDSRAAGNQVSRRFATMRSALGPQRTPLALLLFDVVIGAFSRVEPHILLCGSTKETRAILGHAVFGSVVRKARQTQQPPARIVPTLKYASRGAIAEGTELRAVPVSMMILERTFGSAPH